MSEVRCVIDLVSAAVVGAVDVPVAVEGTGEGADVVDVALADGGGGVCCC